MNVIQLSMLTINLDNVAYCSDRVEPPAGATFEEMRTMMTDLPNVLTVVFNTAEGSFGGLSVELRGEDRERFLAVVAQKNCDLPGKDRIPTYTVCAECGAVSQGNFFCETCRTVMRRKYGWELPTWNAPAEKPCGAEEIRAFLDRLETTSPDQKFVIGVYPGGVPVEGAE